jgi:uncharacterized damage-inducible protein DinB
MRRYLAVAVLVFGATACTPPPPPAPEPPPPSTAVTASLKTPYEIVKGNLTKALEQLPENRLSFRATREVRTFAELFGHVADSSVMICGFASAEKPAEGTAEKTAKTKADLQKALADAFAYCDKVYADLNDQTGAEVATIAFLPQPSTKLGTLSFVTAHNWEHYGNIVTYMRLNKMVPPSSQQ